MKKLPIFFLIALLFSCSEKDKKDSFLNILENLTYTIDTLVVDSGEEFINLSLSLNFSDVSEDKKSLFIFDRGRLSFQEVDLDQMKLLGTYPFEMEGPNGIGKGGIFQLFPDRKLMIPSVTKTAIYNLQGELISNLKLITDELEHTSNIDEFTLLNEIHFDPKSGVFYSLPGNYTSGIRELAIINATTNKGKVVKLPELEKAGNFRVFFNTKNDKAIEMEKYSLSLILEKIYITCTVTSGVYRYNPATDDLEYIEFNHQIIPNEKTGEIINEVYSQKEFNAEYRKVASQISYLKLMWDEETSRFYRLAYKGVLGDQQLEPISYQVFLLAYSEDLELMGETLIPDFNQVPKSYFFKDGKLYSYVNVEDELGFAVFTFDF
ncbi:DUF4221 family protein [Algoriphagus winogradskyi]|uniref:DUF4221 domain-containing protein n=1 Tax=Algoriphagus winogradskyi TaxID=237017 RepID=A0ABY1NNQ5_9BACT|nr:DUF4221 family protein [Algoriphagus winogradskyi]SMP14342.1 protein of unknown function [Algoriphagus winogradskyi]